MFKSSPTSDHWLTAAVSIIGFLLLSCPLQAQIFSWKAAPKVDTRHLRDVYFPTRYVGHAVGDDGCILRSTDKGHTWSVSVSNTSQKLLAVYFVDSLRGHIVGHGGTYLRTTDGGTTWDAPVIMGENFNFRDVYFKNKDEGFIVGECGTIFQTTNGGQMWIQKENIEAGIPLYMNNAVRASGNRVVIASSDKQFLKSDNNATSFSSIPPSAGYSQNNFIALEQAGIYMALLNKNGDMFRSTDNGNTFSNTPTTWSSTGSITSCSILPNGIAYVLSKNGTVVTESIIGGQQTSTLLTSTGMNSIYMLEDSIGWAVGDGGAIFYRGNKCASIKNTAVSLTCCQKDLPYTWRSKMIQNFGSNIALDTVKTTEGCIDTIYTLSLSDIGSEVHITSLSATLCTYDDPTELIADLPGTFTLLNDNTTLTAFDPKDKVGFYQIMFQATDLSICKSSDTIDIIVENCACLLTAQPDTLIIEPFSPTDFDLLANDGLNGSDQINFTHDEVSSFRCRISSVKQGVLKLEALLAVADTFTIAYTISSTDCPLGDTSYLTVINTGEAIVVPVDIITPNDDGINDVLRFNTLDVIPDSELSIYNRWGDRIYHKKDYTNDWDATGYPGGIYYYLLKVKGKEIKKTLTVIK